jgi:hypothetical protein
MKDRLSSLTHVLRGILITLALGFLVMLVLPFIIGPRPPHPTRTLEDLNLLAQAIEYFETEYGRLPSTSELDFEMEGPEAAAFLTILLGKEDPGSEMQNPRQLAFLGMRVAKNKRQGGLVLSPDNKPEGIYDAWGNPLRVILRPPGQTTLTVSHAGEPVTTSKPAFVLSRGRDGTWFTKDDLMSADTNP